MYDISELLASSVNLAAQGRADEFEVLHNASLCRVTCTRDIDFTDTQDTVVLHVLGGGAIPYQVGSKVLIKSYLGSHVSVGVYTKHR